MFLLVVRSSIFVFLLASCFSCFASTIYVWETTAKSYQDTTQDQALINVSSRDGLQQDAINEIAIDQQGLLWIATDSGLNRWDGQRILAPSRIERLLENQSVTNIYAHGASTLIFGTYTQGLYIYDIATFESFALEAPSHPSQSDWTQSVQSITKQDRDIVLIAFDHKIYSLNTKTQSFVPLLQMPAKLVADNHVIRAIEFHSGHLYIGTTDGLYHTHIDSLSSFSKIEFLPSTVTLSIENSNVKSLAVHDGQLLVGTVNGLYAFPIESHKHQVSSTVQLANRNIWDIKVDRSRILLGTDDGVYTKSMALEQEYSVLAKPRLGFQQLTLRDAVSIELDREGNVWMGTMQAGVFGAPNLARHLTYVANNEANDQNLLTSNIVWSIFEDNDGLWVGTDQGLSVIKAGGAQIIFETDSPETNPQFYIYRILESKQPDTLILETADGMYWLDKKTKELTSISSLVQLSGRYHYGSFVDSKSDLWFVDQQNLYRFDEEKKSIAYTAMEQEPIGVMEQIFFEQSSGILVADYAGLKLIDSTTLAMTDYFKLPQSIIDSGAYITDTMFTDEHLWIAVTGYGVLVINKDTLEIEQEIGKNQLKNTSNTFSVLQDRQGFVWVSSHSGLFRIDPIDFSILHLNARKEIRIAEFNEGAFSMLDSGKLVFGSNRGLVVIKPENLLSISNKRNTLFSRVYLENVATLTTQNELSLKETNNDFLEINHDEKILDLTLSNRNLTGFFNEGLLINIYKDGDLYFTKSTLDGKVSIPLSGHGQYKVEASPRFNINAISPLLQIHKKVHPLLSTWAVFSYLCALMLLLIIAYRLRNIYQEKRLALYSQLAIMDSAFSQANVGLIVTDDKFGLLINNNRFTEICQSSSGPAGFNAFIKTLKSDYVDLHQRIQAASQGESVSGQIFLKIKKKSLYINLNAVKIHLDSEHHNAGVLISLEDCTEKVEHEAEIAKLKMQDNLTGLMNRQQFIERLDHSIDGSALESATVLFVDLDTFKGINETLGYTVGDKVIRIAGQRLKNAVSHRDLVCRATADEFLVLLTDVYRNEQIFALLERITESIAQPMLIDNHKISISCTIGTANYPTDAKNASALIECADVAMKRAKDDPSTSVKEYSTHMSLEAVEKFELLSLIRRAIEARSFYNVYQPVYCLKNNKVVGIELLLRCALEEHNIGPDKFIPVLEKTKQIVSLTEIAIEQAFEDLKRIETAGFDGFIAINLSAMHFTQNTFPAWLKERLRKHHVSASRIKFEITEGLLIEKSKLTLEILNALRQMGCTIALDDFGTGYSSLSYIKDFPLDSLKIDRSFVNDLTIDEKSKGLTETIISMSSTLGLDIIAEGVETSKQLEVLKQIGCDFVQGYLIAKPMPIESLYQLTLSEQKGGDSKVIQLRGQSKS